MDSVGSFGKLVPTVLDDSLLKLINKFSSRLIGIIDGNVRTTSVYSCHDLSDVLTLFVFSVDQWMPLS